MKAERHEGDAEEKSKANRSWFMKFKGRNCLPSQGEAASADVEAATSYPKNLAISSNEGGTLNNRFSVLMKTAFYWKKMPSRTFTTREEESVPGSGLQGPG